MRKENSCIVNKKIESRIIAEKRDGPATEVSSEMSIVSIDMLCTALVLVHRREGEKASASCTAAVRGVSCVSCEL